MITVPHQSLRRSWPQEFSSKRRLFSRQAENQPYIEWLQAVQASLDDGEEDGDENNEEDDFVDSNENEVHRQGDKSKRRDENRNNNVRIFMKGTIGDEDTLHYPDQVERVAGFCEQPSIKESEKHLVLLDDRSNSDTIEEKPGHSRLHQRPLTSQQLREELSKQRFRVELNQKAAPDGFGNGEGDIEKRVIFVADLQPSTIEALATTAPRSHAPALKNLFYKYLTSKMSISVTFSSRDFCIFNLDFHIPYYVLKQSKESLQDPRKTFDGKPLRESWALPLPPSPMSMPTDRPYYLYEAQISVAVTGIDHWVWTAYEFVDTYFRSKESIDSYYQSKKPMGWLDPPKSRLIATNTTSWTPREYFFGVLQIRINEVRREWLVIIDKVEGDVKHGGTPEFLLLSGRMSRTNPIFSLLSNDPKTRQELREFNIWCNQMVKLLRQLIRRLSETISAWDEFENHEIGYFLYDGESPTTSSSLKFSLGAVNKAFSDLKDILRKLRYLERELCKDNPQGLNAYLSFQNHEAAVFQQRTAKHIQILTFITLVLLPPGLALSIFSTPGVLPSIPNLERITYTFLFLAVSVVVMVIVSFTWDSWFRPIVEFMMAELRRASQRIFFLGRPRKADLPTRWDLENPSVSFESFESSKTTENISGKDKLSKFNEFAESLNETSSRIFPTNGQRRSHYKSINVLLLRWEDDELGVEVELNALRGVFGERYGFATDTWLIPSEGSHFRLTSKVLQYVREHDSPDSLLIIYYGGHALVTDARQAQWSCNTKPGSPSLNWSATQTLFEQAESDVLVILDCCHAATTASNPGRGATELIAACGFESMAPAPGPRSFTSSLIGVLSEWDDRCFSIAMLHHEVLFRLKHERPEKSPYTKRWREVRSTPIHVFSSADPMRHSINLSKMRPKATSEYKVYSNPAAMHANPPDYTTACAAPLKQNSSFNKEAWVTPAEDILPPCLLFSIRLKEEVLLDLGHWKSWLSSIPVNVEFVGVKMAFSKDKLSKTRIASPFLLRKSLGSTRKSKESPTATEHPKSENSCGTHEDLVSTVLPNLGDSRKRLSTKAEMLVHVMVENFISHPDLCTPVRPKATLSRQMFTTDLPMACRMDPTSKHDSEEITQSFKPLQYPSDFPTKTTTALLLGPKRGLSDEMADQGSVTSEEDLRWDVSEVDEISTLGGHERSSRDFHSSDATTIEGVLRTSSASLKRDLVELLMGEYYQIFDRHDSGQYKNCMGGPAASKSATARNPPGQNTGSSASKGKRKATDEDEDWGDEGDDKSTRKRPKDSPDRPAVRKTIRRYACPYNKHDPRRFRRSTGPDYEACDNKGFDTIGHMKEHLLRRHYERNKCPRCKTQQSAAEFKSHLESLQGCQPRTEHQGDVEIGFSQVFAVGLKVKKRSGSEAEGIERWKETYHELFPNDSMPSPFFSTEGDCYSVDNESPQLIAQSVDQNLLQPQAVQARFQEQVDMVVDTAVNSLQPAVRDLLEQAPATIRDEYDPNPTDWSTMGQFDTFWSGYPTVTQSDWAGPSGNGNQIQLDPANLALMPETQQSSEFSTNPSTNLNSTAFQNVQDALSSVKESDGFALYNVPRARSAGRASYTSQDESYIDSRVLTLLKSHFSLLVAELRTQFLPDLSPHSRPPIPPLRLPNGMLSGGQNQNITPPGSEMTENSGGGTAQQGIHSEAGRQRPTEAREEAASFQTRHTAAQGAQNTDIPQSPSLGNCTRRLSQYASVSDN